MQMKVLVADALSKEGVDIMKRVADVDVKTGLKEAEIIPIIGNYEGLVVRSQTQVTAPIIEAGKKLIIIGRAGVGVDNIDLETATRRGILVVNAPTGNTISAAEHAIALMLALARYIPAAHFALKAGKWERSKFTGTEVRGKTLGVIGLGNVGSAVARRARGLEMKLIGYDPFVSQDHARNLQVEIVTLERLYKEADFISLHIPLTAQTKEMINTKELAMMKPTARIINTARGGLINEEALANALKEKKITGAAVDVFPQEPCTSSLLFSLDNVIVTPHLGASTAEAQVTAASDVAEQIVDVFKGLPPKYAVNAPFIPPEMMAILNPFVAVATRIGMLASQMSEGQMNALTVKYEGEITRYDTNAIKAAMVGGLLANISEEKVNLVNANLIAGRRGLVVTEQKDATCQNYASLITAIVATSAGSTEISGTVLRGESHLVRVDNYWIDFIPTSGPFLFVDHKDRPGLIGAVGNITGSVDVNISAMYVSRQQARGKALMILDLDETLPEAAIKKILEIPDVYTAKTIQFA
jgi:D-3-phosphoglycerate dehydrogenase / 2-oxoglutarate reductase